MRRNTAFFGFNRGIISPLALARVDMKRVALSAETMENWVPRVLGSMMLRPGMKYLGSTDADAKARFLPFVFATADTALLEFTSLTMRVWVNDALVTRVAVSSAVVNGDFTTNVASWTDSDEAGADSIWSADYSGSMKLRGDTTEAFAARRDQQVTVSGADANKEHALRIVIPRGPLKILVGSAQGEGDYIETELATGNHSLAFTPTGSFWIRFQNTKRTYKYVSDVNVEAAGVMEIPAPWATADLRNLRYDQSGDIVFIACRNFLQRAVERRSTTSWSLVRYLSDNGPFGLENTDAAITLTAGATQGNTTLTASRPIFSASHVDTALFKSRATSTSTHEGVSRVVAFTTGTIVDIEVLTTFASTAATQFWSESLWSGVQGFPSATAFYEGRLWWSGKNGIWGSVSDDFYNFDDTTIGDSGPINRTVGSGPVDNINWILPLQRMILGAEGAEWSVRASSFDEVLTPSNFNLKRASSQGSINTIAAQIDSRGVFVSRGGTRLFELTLGGDSGDYESNELTLVAPEVGEPEIVHVAVQRLPDTRVHCVRSDGKVALLVYNVAENVSCWVLIATDGVIEDVVVLPGTVEDSVYYVVKRTINSVEKRYLEKWALESEAIGGVINKIADSYFVFDDPGSPVTTITGLNHLEGKLVSVWGNSKDQGEKTVVGGQIEFLTEALDFAIIGLPYTAQWKSTKLSYLVAGEPMSMAQPKSLVHLGLILSNAYYKAITYGPDFNNLDDMPEIEDGKEIAQDTLNASYDADLFEFDGVFDTDARLCIQAMSPRPVTVLAAVVSYASDEKS